MKLKGFQNLIQSKIIFADTGREAKRYLLAMHNQGPRDADHLGIKVIKAKRLSKRPGKWEVFYRPSLNRTGE